MRFDYTGNLTTRPLARWVPLIYAEIFEALDLAITPPTPIETGSKSWRSAKGLLGVAD